ncbi:MAG: tRNA (adenosine(37)-N6)-threonylcarbamoyltransferase complex transferase subunit TsaD [Bacteroidetes bacterium CG2_30_33_31]|nr:MAG: tRNA (adenosine(37)-N6)-threonylcarbamoyltransferase complex transferase subunit TsaD [Bacteroidetes bacterium CG2_30_33_31]
MNEPIILAIESSCDDTSAAILQGRRVLANVIASQDVHKKYGGVVPELASRAHQQNIVPVVDNALKESGLTKRDLSAIAFTRGPGLLGSLLVGTSFVKGLALGLNIPLIEIDHLQAHILAHFIDSGGNNVPAFPFLCLTVSGGHSQIVLVRDYFDMEIIGKTIDDAAGEAFDKSAKILGLPYPGGPLIDKLAAEGDALSFNFPKPKIQGFDYSFSGLKTSFLYFIRDELKNNPLFIEENKVNLAASIQRIIVEVLMDKLIKASKELQINQIAVAGGVSANSELRKQIMLGQAKYGWQSFIPPFNFTTDNAAMVGIAGYYKYLKKEFIGLDFAPYARALHKS